MVWRATANYERNILKFLTGEPSKAINTGRAEGKNTIDIKPPPPHPRFTPSL